MPTPEGDIQHALSLLQTPGSQTRSAERQPSLLCPTALASPRAAQRLPGILPSPTEEDTLAPLASVRLVLVFYFLGRETMGLIRTL